jgi:hypothetical protein
VNTDFSHYSLDFVSTSDLLWWRSQDVDLSQPETNLPRSTTTLSRKSFGNLIFIIQRQNELLRDLPAQILQLFVRPKTNVYMIKSVELRINPIGTLHAARNSIEIAASPSLINNHWKKIYTIYTIY